MKGEASANTPAAITSSRAEGWTFGPQGPKPTNDPTAIPKTSGKQLKNTAYARGLRRKTWGAIDSILIRGPTIQHSPKTVNGGLDCRYEFKNNYTQGRLM